MPDLEVYPIGSPRLRTMLRWRKHDADDSPAAQAAAELDNRAGRNRIAELLEPYVVALEPDQYTRFRGFVTPGEEVGLLRIDLELESDLLSASDRFSFQLQHDRESDELALLRGAKFPQGFGTDGCVPLKQRTRLNPKVMKDPTVFKVGERFGRIIEEWEVRWDWQPRWNFDAARLGGSEAERTIADLLNYLSYEDQPPYVLIATWSFSVLQQEWGEEGRFVQLILNPVNEETLHNLGDQWYLLY